MAINPHKMNHSQSMQTSIGVIIPTFQAAKHLPHCLTPLMESPLKPRILLIDSSSTDSTVSIAHSFGIEVIVIPANEFNHGATRERARLHLQSDIVVMLTQDAYPASSNMLEKLVEPILNFKASISYARQLPHSGANYLAAFARHFNYPEFSHIRSIDDVKTYGAYTFFCSNSCAAYRNSALDEIGGFPSALFGEDTIVVAKLLRRKHSIAYVADAEVFHSHNYTLKQEFKRHFDMGFSRYAYRNLFLVQGSVNQRGKVYFKTLITDLWKTSPLLIPYACFQTLIKFFGYYTGKLAFQMRELLTCVKLKRS